jgi:hypothetical protein
MMVLPNPSLLNQGGASGLVGRGATGPQVHGDRGASRDGGRPAHTPPERLSADVEDDAEKSFAKTGICSGGQNDDCGLNDDEQIERADKLGFADPSTPLPGSCNGFRWEKLPECTTEVTVEWLQGSFGTLAPFSFHSSTKFCWSSK